MKELLSHAAERAIRYLEDLPERRVFPVPEACQRLVELEFDFPEGHHFLDKVFLSRYLFTENPAPRNERGSFISHR
jgi:hypothetical protein